MHSANVTFTTSHRHHIDSLKLTSVTYTQNVLLLCTLWCISDSGLSPIQIASKEGYLTKLGYHRKVVATIDEYTDEYHVTRNTSLKPYSWFYISWLRLLQIE